MISIWIYKTRRFKIVFNDFYIISNNVNHLIFIMMIYFDVSGIKNLHLNRWYYKFIRILIHQQISWKWSKKRRTRIDSKRVLKIRHIVCCLKNELILDRGVKIVFKSFLEIRQQVIWIKLWTKCMDVKIYK